ncbi:MAG: hypothetical protein LBS26_01615 [Campylobacteraceae bacterium]|nr:hypothetical protein [Campylobacteraceae bacterium]
MRHSLACARNARPFSKTNTAIADDLAHFNLDQQIKLAIDTLRFEYSKQYKREKVNQLGQWIKLTKGHSLCSKLAKRLTKKELTSVYRLENENIYFYNYSNPPKYRDAMLVIFGISQPDKEPNHDLIRKVTSFLPITSLDICLDTPSEPNLDALSKHFALTRYKDTNTYYINQTGYPSLDKITIYNKQSKNRLSYPLWRIEATITIPTANPELLSLPLSEFKHIIDLACN